MKTAGTETTISFALRRREKFLGKILKHGESEGQAFVRLSAKKSGWIRPVHEVWKTEDHVITLNHPLIHEGTPTISEFVEKINRYSTIRAQELHKQKVRVNTLSLLFYPLAKFLHNYIVRYGFLDGTHGFVHAAFMSFHSFLVRGKLLLLQKKTHSPSCN